MDNVRLDDFVAAVAEVLHDKHEHAFMDSDWILKQYALMIAEQLLVRKREIHQRTVANWPWKASRISVSYPRRSCNQ